MPNNLTKKKFREFGIILGLGIPFLIGIVIPFITGHSLPISTLWLGLFFLFFGIFCPTYLKNIYFAWIKIGNLLGFINSHIILGFVFIMILQPIALFARLLCYDPLRKKFNKISSYAEKKTNQQIDFKKIF